MVLLICTAEKSFSTKKRVKNFLRNKMGSYSLSITGKYQLSRPPPPPQFSPGYVFFQYKRVLVCYAKQKKGGNEKGSNIPKSCLEPVQALSLHRMQVPSTNHKYEDHNHTSHQHRLQWDTNKNVDVGSFIGTA
ncbi:hypothetical protein J6590_067751 [Homalodisca vitripennis]|nr:hypothetical protein J6590_067751 [Homalodisca vitripennis]